MIFPRHARVYHKRTFSDGVVQVTGQDRAYVKFDEGQELRGEHWIPNEQLAMTAEAQVEIAPSVIAPKKLDARMVALMEIGYLQEQTRVLSRRMRELRDRL